MARKRKRPATMRAPTGKPDNESDGELVRRIYDDDDDDDDAGKKDVPGEGTLEEDDADDDDEEGEDDDGDDDDDGEEEEDEKINPTDREAVRKLLEPFEKDRLMQLIRDAASKNPSLYSRLTSSAESDPVLRKIFVHGLGWDITNESLATAFRSYGDIEECKAVADRATGRCKGYGFVTFRTADAARKALQEPQKQIVGRLASCQLASVGPPPPHPSSEPAIHKLFVSCVPDGTKCQTGMEGLKTNTSSPMPMAPSITASSAVLRPDDLALTYGSASVMGLNMNPVGGLLGRGNNPPVGFVGQNAGVGLLSAAAGLTPPVVNRNGAIPMAYGIGSGISGKGSGINSISPSMIGSYGSRAIFQGLGGYQSSEMPSMAATRVSTNILQGLGSYQSGQIPSTAAMKTPTSIESVGTGLLHHYLGQ